MKRWQWKHEGWIARRWDLLEGTRVVASLRQRGWSGADADLTVLGRAWKLDTTGVFRWRIAAVDEGGHEVAHMAVNWRGTGEPILSDGRRFRWDAVNLWGSRYELKDAEGGVVARVHMDRFLVMDASMDIEEGRLTETELVALLAVSWHALVLTMAAAASAGA